MNMFGILLILSKTVNLSRSEVESEVGELGIVKPQS